MTPNRSTDQASLREMNLSAVLRFIYHGAPLSRSQLAGKTGLNKSTISSLVEDLLDRRLVHETGMNSIGKGRPSTMLEINPRAGAVIAVELGVDFLSAAIVDFTGGIVWRTSHPADPAASQQNTLGQIMDIVQHTAEVCRLREQRILGLSFSVPGTVDLEQGILIYAPNLGWRNVRFRELFASATGLSVFIENDANAAAVAEHLFGAARHTRDFLFVFAGVGLGGGLFLDDTLYRGVGGYAGEIGHTPIIAEPFQNPCHCGNVGCWETYVNQASILRRVETRLQRGAVASAIPTLMTDQCSPLSLAIVKQAADLGDGIALEALAEAGAALGTGFAVLTNIFNPGKIILGGPVSLAGPYLMPSIRQSLAEHAMREILSQVQIDLSAFGPDASLVGAAAVIVDDILQHPSHVAKEVMPRLVTPL